MIEEASGNLLEARVDALVNTVNTAGVMGKGIALQFKRAFPDNFRHYQRACRAGQVTIGKMFVHPVQSLSGPKFIINFPTKRHWKSRSRLEDIEAGLHDLREVVKRLGIRSVAVPPLGCGNGGLDWEDVYPLIRRNLTDVEGVRFFVYLPAGAPDPSSMITRTRRPKMTRMRAEFLFALERYMQRSIESGLSETGTISLVEVQKAAYFLQLAGGGSKWDFNPSYFGPYAPEIDRFVSSVEGHFVRGYGDGTGGSKATLTLDGGALKEAHALLDDDERFGRVLDRFDEIVAGFEFPYGIELLSTVHYVVHRSSESPPLEDVVAEIKAWSNRKGQLFKERQAAIAYQHLVDADVVPAPVLA